jgi:hypothetical protein
LTVTAAVAATILAFSASPAASVTIGQLDPAPVAETDCSENLEVLQASVSSGNSYVVPPLPPASSLSVTSWTTNATDEANQPLTMKIFRKIGEPATYQVVGHDGPRTLTAGGVSGNTFPASIAVQPGDVLGVSTGAGTAACVFEGVAGNPLVRGGNLADGESGDFVPGPPARVNATAIVVPTNSFSVGRVTRNRKKGTAKVTVEVPNPGTLAASGKGVKGGAAGTSAVATVPAPGAAKLLIRAKGKRKRTLNKVGKVMLKTRITFTPTGGDPSTQPLKLKLLKRL